MVLALMYKMLTSFEIKEFHKEARKNVKMCVGPVCACLCLSGKWEILSRICPDNNQPERDAKPQSQSLKIKVNISNLSLTYFTLLLFTFFLNIYITQKC